MSRERRGPVLPTRETNSATSRDLPTPGSPTTVTSRHARSGSDRCELLLEHLELLGSTGERRPLAPYRRARGRRPRGDGTRGRPPTSPSRRSARQPRRRPRRARADRSPRRGAPLPAPAACSSRAATLTGSPVTNVSRSEASPATTSPVLTPIRSAIRVPKRRSSSSFRAPRRACISSAARHARSASSSCASGTPKTASTASPTNFSTVPPCRSSAPRISWK